jgi:hypothetical protein
VHIQDGTTDTHANGRWKVEVIERFRYGGSDQKQLYLPRYLILSISGEVLGSGTRVLARSDGGSVVMLSFPTTTRLGVRARSGELSPFSSIHLASPIIPPAGLIR